MSPASNRIREDSQVKKDYHRLTVDCHDSGTTVNKLLKRRDNKKDTQPKTSRATKLTQRPEERPNLTKLKSTAKSCRLEKLIEEELSGGQDDLMPQLTSNLTPYQDEAVTSKTPRPTPKPRSQASCHREEQSTLTGKETYIQDKSLY